MLKEVSNVNMAIKSKINFNIRKRLLIPRESLMPFISKKNGTKKEPNEKKA